MLDNSLLEHCLVKYGKLLVGIQVDGIINVAHFKTPASPQ